MKKLYATIFSLACLYSATAQTAGGNAFRIDFDEFNSGAGETKYFDCGNDNSLNTPDELTVMVWVQFRDYNDDQKIIGKYNLDNSGFSFGVITGRAYPAIFNPDFVQTTEGLMNPVAQYWYHLTYVFKAGDTMKSYINGIEVGSLPVTNPIVTNVANHMFIGVASWGNQEAFQGFGNYDEIGMYNVALTPEQIRAQMFVPLTGNETGLVAAYDFNQSTGSNLPDISGNGNDGVGANFTGSEWVISRAPLASADMTNAEDLNGLWNGIALMDPRFTSTTNGMNLLASGLDTAEYAVFGHNGMGGTTTMDIPANASANFERTGRVWMMNVDGSIESDVFINLNDAADGGATIDANAPVANYTLLYRAFGETQFQALAQGDALSNGSVTFEDVNLLIGEYALGLGDEPIQPSSIAERAITDAITVFPNPSNGKFQMKIDGAITDNATVEVYDLGGRVVYQQSLQGQTEGPVTIDLGNTENGLYLLKVTSDQTTYSQRIMVK